MILKNGITGFHDARDAFHNPQDEHQFKQICYDLTHQYKGSLLSLDCSMHAKNFYIAHLSLFKTQYYILLNAYYPYLIFASSVNAQKIVFIDPPEDIELTFLPYEVLHVKDILQSYDSNVENTLNQAELKQIKHWKPNSFGEIIYNHWD